MGTVRSIKVLIVDDNAQAAASLATLLSLDGHEVSCVGNGRDALEAARRFRPEVVLLDIELPGMSGYEVARRLREDPALEGMRIAALSGHGSAEDRRRSLESGCDEHLVKPVDEQALLRLLETAT
jgi:CheY-like chemotaxis protein